MEYGFSIIMPTYNQCSFIRRAIISVLNQTFLKWELIIVNDGSTDETYKYISEFLSDDRIKYIENEYNTGLGHSINQGLNLARYDFISYLPSDDFYYKDHLKVISEKLFSEGVILAYSGTRWDYRDSLHAALEVDSVFGRKGFSMQLVQVAHRKTTEKWVERNEWISDDLFIMYWVKLLRYGNFVCTGKITTYWTCHPWQRHLIINEKYGGGLNKIRSFYHIKNPIKLKVSKEKFIDEELEYKNYKQSFKTTSKSLKILIVGELAYNPQRIYALEQAGHKLYALWVPFPNLSFATVGPLPFGNVEDILLENWKENVDRVKPDIIYALLNWGSINWAYEVMKSFPKIPFAWHFKEGPYMAIGAGNWDKLIYLYSHADLKIYLNKSVRNFYNQFIPNTGEEMILDGDLPKQDYFKDTFSPKLSQKDGEIHTVCAGRLIGLGEDVLEILSSNKIHVHLYLENFHSSKASIFKFYKRKYSKYFHIHNHCEAENWTKEFSKYDAGWLHCIRSSNGGTIMNATWDDLNIPARLSTYAAAGIPVIAPQNEGNIVAIREELLDKGFGILFADFYDLIVQLHLKGLLEEKQRNMLKYRMEYSFDYHVPRLIKMFKTVISKKNERVVENYS